MIIFFATSHFYKILNPGEMAQNEYWEIYGAIVVLMIQF